LLDRDFETNKQKADDMVRLLLITRFTEEDNLFTGFVYLGVFDR